jgi:chemotaxis protein methyltransferase CheR
VNDRDCVAFLQWCLPQLGMRWNGVRKVRRQVCKRISRRVGDLGLSGPKAYRRYLASHEQEWKTLGGLCRVTISRFYRDRGVWIELRSRVLPGLAAAAAGRGAECVRCWSAGCASGEEAYTLMLLWPPEGASPAAPDAAAGDLVALEVTATDADEHLLDRARSGRYPSSSLKDLPAELRERAFFADGEAFAIADSFKRRVRFEKRDLRDAPPDGPFDLVLCRNAAFTYFDERGQHATLVAISRVLIPGGVLVIGIHEHLPGDGAGFEPIARVPGAYRRGSTPPPRASRNPRHEFVIENR